MKYLFLVILTVFIISDISFADDASPKVFSAYNSPVFHKKDCGKLPSNVELVEFSSVKEAIYKHALPCKSCIKQGFTNLKKLQFSVADYDSYSASVKVQSSKLKRFLDECIEELHHLDTESGELADKWTLIRKHPQYFGVDSKLKEIEVIAFVEESSKISSLYAEMRENLSEKEKAVLKKIVELSEQSNSFFEQVGIIDNIRFQLYDRFESLKARMLRVVQNDDSYGESSQYILLAHELFTKFETIVTILEQFIERFSVDQEFGG
jgi:hypothetical protein|tara:strand:- start:58 stop:852 length:795 start_codon:yes stop_codon:yes gene_type:complete